MKRNVQLLVLAVLAFGVQGASSVNALAQGVSQIAHESTFPADGEGPFDLAALDTYADRYARTHGAEWGVNVASTESVYPMDGEGPFDLIAPDSYAERYARTHGPQWGVSLRSPEGSDPFPFGEPQIDD